MDIFGKDRDAHRKLLTLYTSKELMFSPLRSSTVTAKGKLTNIQFNEKNFADEKVTDEDGQTEIVQAFNCTKQIVTADSNFTHSKYAGWEEPTKKKKSNRGRKKKAKKKKARKIQGTGDCMNSQIQFGSIGSHIRLAPEFEDKHSKTSIAVNYPVGTKIYIAHNGSDSCIYESLEDAETPDADGELPLHITPYTIQTHEPLELVTKCYKFLLFRNGKFTLPGVLTEDMSDAEWPVQALCEFLLDEMSVEGVNVEYIEPTMRNYKFQLMDRCIDLLRLQKFCSDHFHTLLNIHFRHIEEYLINEIDPDDEDIDYDHLRKYLENAPAPKNLYVKFSKLTEHLDEFDVMYQYQKIWEFTNIVYEHFQVNLDDGLLHRIWRSYIKKFLQKLELHLKKDKDNMLSHIKYDPEKYPGFIIKIKTPLKGNPNKRTTIKLFKSGKIDIDGANSRYQAEFIYYWLNSLFVDNRWLTYNPDDPSDSDDDEFSFSAEDD